MRVSKGSSRWVVLCGGLAFKFPSMYNWRSFLNGLLANMTEVEFSKVDAFKDKLCPIKCYMPLGFLVVMPRVQVLKPLEMSKDDLERFCDVGDGIIPAEIKEDSFGWYKGKLVAIDYG